MIKISFDANFLAATVSLTKTFGLNPKDSQFALLKFEKRSSFIADGSLHGRIHINYGIFPSITCLQIYQTKLETLEKQKIPRISRSYKDFLRVKYFLKNCSWVDKNPDKCQTMEILNFSNLKITRKNMKQPMVENSDVIQTGSHYKYLRGKRMA